MSTFSDGSILKMLGVALSRDAHGTVRPVPTDRSHVLYRRCSFCSRSMGTKQCEDERLAGYFTDGICPKCHAKIKHDLQIAA